MIWLAMAGAFTLGAVVGAIGMYAVIMLSIKYGT